MASVYLIIGIVLSLVGFYIKYELKQDGFCISGGDTAIFAIISFIISIVPERRTYDEIYQYRVW